MHTLTEVAEHPSGWDSRSNYAGRDLDELSNLYVVLTRTRDSDLLSESNWDAALKLLGGESEDCIIHRFGHWACGWWEALCVTENLRAKGEEIEERLKDYPVLDETDFSEREWNAAQDTWVGLSLAERVTLCQEARISVFAARHDSIPQEDTGYIFERCCGY